MSFWTRIRVAALILVSVFVAAPLAEAAYTFTAVDAPGAVRGTYLYGISGSTVVGLYFDANNSAHGFMLDGGTFSSINCPLAGSAYLQGTFVSGISGSTIFGGYIDANNVEHGFTYDAIIFTSYDAPGAGLNATQGTRIAAIDGSNYAGSYTNAAGTFGFVSSANGANFTKLSDPAGATDTIVLGLAGNTAVGTYGANNARQGFVFDKNTSTYTTVDDPLGRTIIRSSAGGSLYGTFIDGQNIDHGFIYDGHSFETFDDPAGNASIQAVSDTALVGFYFDPSVGTDRGFIATTPEPTAVGIFFLGGSLLALRRHKVWR